MTRPRTPIGTYGSIGVTRVGRGRFVASTRYRDLDGVVRQVEATHSSRSACVRELKLRLQARHGYGRGGVLHPSSPFGDLAELWLDELERRDIRDNTKDNYRDDLRLHVRPFFENYTLGEITTGRVEHFLKTELQVSYSRAKHSRTVLNQLFSFALRHDAMSRNPVEGTSSLARPKHYVQALTLAQVQAIRAAAALWRTAPDVMGPKPDGQVRDAIEVLLGTSLRPGEVLGLRPVDVSEGRKGMVVHVQGTVVYREGRGTYRQEFPKTEASARYVAVPEFAARVLRRRLRGMTAGQREVTIFRNRKDGPLSQHNFRRTFREFLVLAGLEDSGISPRWYRRTGATVLARGLGADVAATYLGHTSTAVTEGHYIEPDRSIDFSPADLLERCLRPVDPDGALLAASQSDEEDFLLDELDELDGAEAG